MSGVLWAAAAGIGFGLFQTVNRAALLDMDVYESTFIQLTISAVILMVASVATEDLSQLRQAPIGALGEFALAGMVHFFLGWTLLNASQKRIGAARTSPLLAAAPLFGAVIAAVAIKEVPTTVSLLGVALIIIGVYVVTLERIPARDRVGVESAGGPAAVAGDVSTYNHRSRWKASLFGLGTALCWGTSPIFIRRGLDGLPSPLLGVTIGLLAAVAAYGIAILLARRPVISLSRSRQALAWKAAAGMLVGLSTWTRWYALSLVPVAVVLGLGLLSVPTVILLAPLLVGQHLERVTPRVVGGSGVVLLGALVLILRS
jgi:drug/metabolite transporter (DMT)-like permease